MSDDHKSISLANPNPYGLNGLHKLSIGLISISILILVLAMANLTAGYNGVLVYVCLGFIFLGTVFYTKAIYTNQPEGIKNHYVWFRSFSAKGTFAWILGIILTGFYVLLYWFPVFLGLGKDGVANTGIIALFDPLSIAIKGKVASQWFLYGTLYTILILALGYKFIVKYKHNRYQIIRTIVVMISQLFLAYLIPEILEGLSDPNAGYFAKDLKYFWPLNYQFFEPWHIDNLNKGGNLGKFYLVWGLALFLVLTPIITFFVGKRWYCSWVCGCGGLAETAGDSFRQLSSKKLSSWKLERWMIHTVMVLVFIMTAVVLYGYFKGTGEIFGISIYNYFSKPYGFLIGSMFSGVVGVGFYPILGNRVWCRFGCPLAGYMGLFQRFTSRFRITTNGAQCISCGNCSTYCEQGIDVRAYAQKGKNIVRASCVGCGICSAVCPRGVLKLENGPLENRIENNPIQVMEEMVNGE